MWRALVLVVIACSKTRQPAPQVATEPWRWATYARGGAVMHLGVKLAFVAPDGVVRWRAALANTHELENLHVAGDALVTVDERGVRALDLATGRERWHRAGEVEHIAWGERSIAIDREIVSLVSGATIYTAAKHQWLTTDDAGFLFGGDDAVWAVDGATGRERWRQAIDAPLWIRLTPTTAIVHAAHDAWWELDLASGRVVGHGVLAATPGDPVFGDELGDRFSRVGKTLACTDPRGTLRWRVPIEDAPRIRRQVTDGERVALIDELGRPAYLIDLHGSVHEPRATSFVGFAGPCALTRRSELILDCTEVATGLIMWSTLLREHETICPLAQGALMVDGGRISRLDGNGKQRWHVDLPDDTRLADCAADTVVLTSGSDERDDHAVHVLDVTSGKLTAVAL